VGETVGVIPTHPNGPVDSPVQEKLPGKVGIIVGSLLIVAGIVLGIVLVVSGALSLVDGFDDLQRVDVGSRGTVQIDETGTQSVYAERPTTTGGGSFSSGGGFGVFVPDIQVSVQGPDGSPVVVSPSNGDETYEWDGREGVKIAQFRAEEPGQYVISAIPGDGMGQYDTVAVGTAVDIGGLLPILGGFFGGGLLSLVGLIVLIVALVRRSKAKKARSQPANPWGGGWGAPPMAGAGAGGYGAPGYGAPGYGTPGYGAPADAPGWVPPPSPPPTSPGGWNPGAPPPADPPGWSPGAPPPAAAPWTPPGQAAPPPPANPAPTTWEAPPSPWPGAPSAEPGDGSPPPTSGSSS
jgi:hypothetical protein